jgi:anti-sigma B factor antagonist
MGGDLDVALAGGGERVTLALSGELDLETAGAVEVAVRDALARDPAAITIDLRGVVFMDSTGLRTLITVSRCTSQAGLDLEIVRGPDNVHRVFEVTGMSGRLPLVDRPQG